LGDEILVASAAPQATVVEHSPEKETPMTQALSQSLNGNRNDDCSVGLVLTGGTIGAKEDDSVLSVGQDPTRAEAGLLASEWPGPGEPHVVVRSPLRQLSENLEPQDWILIANAVRELVEADGVAGVLVLHGTDTMGYTAAALSFLLSDLERPVVLTGSKLPSGEPGSDASRNVHAALVALQALGRGVYVAFAGSSDLAELVYLGTRLRKLRASGEAFASVNRDLVGIVEANEFKSQQLHTPDADERFVQAVDEHVLALRLYPGLDLDVIFESVVRGHIRGVVIELYASATGPDTENRFSVTRFIRRCTDRGIIVGTAVAAAPTANGKVYETTIAIQKAGGVFLRDMLPETATVKMMWALAQSRDVATIRSLMVRPVAGELIASDSESH
jgi:L-asparaginase type I